MKNIVYVSTAVELLEDEILIDILSSSRKNNLDHNVTGILLYSHGTFIQVIEGDDEGVDFIFKKIVADLRHKNLITLINDAIAQRAFPDWAMGFTTAKSGKVENLVGYLKSLDHLHTKPENTAAITTLKTFIETNELTVRY